MVKKNDNFMITEKQLQALKYLIIKSKDASDFSKRICFFLLDKSDLLTKPVCTTIIENKEISREQVNDFNHGNHDMRSFGGSTHLHALMGVTGSPFYFSGHCGHYSKGGLWDTTSDEYSGTIWLSPISYDHHAHKLIFDIKVIDSISLKSEFYSSVHE
jgi:hypothetical protein